MTQGLHDLEARRFAQCAKPVRAVTEVVVRLLVQPKLKGRRQQQDAVVLQHAPHLVHQQAGVRRVLEHLHVEDGVEALIREGQALAVVVEIRLLLVRRGVRLLERRLVLDADVLGHVGAKDVLVRTLAAAHVEQPTASLGRDSFEQRDE